eukprot:CAMPEP_0185159942 /NCGR_PEP_ID=MMETSP1139-20130426/3355_1 /TAXON_ID=298111 /ORGANISM="Pavlova sp., Strain CCMP459" /LENGTH=933 /DNA_ID=CAMNT_0027725135 /DNA_START=63 /DNA_END=2864 /DNA_ORIENTATION=+
MMGHRRSIAGHGPDAARRGPGRSSLEGPASLENSFGRTSLVQQQLEHGKLKAEASKRDRLAPQRAARELYVSPTASAKGQTMGGLQIASLSSSTGGGASGATPGPAGDAGPVLPPLPPSSRRRSSADSNSELQEENRSLKARMNEFRAEQGQLLSRFAEMEKELSQLRTRASEAEASEKQLRSDMKHITQRNAVLEKINEQLRSEKHKAEARAEAEADTGPRQLSTVSETAGPVAVGTDASAATTVQTSPIELERPQRPSTPQHTHTFLALVERGLTKELDRAAAADKAGAPPSPARTGHQLSLRTQLRQLADMQKEVNQLQKYTEAVQSFSDKLTQQLRIKERDNKDMSAKLEEQQREAEHALAQATAQLAEAKQQLQQAQHHAAEWKEKASEAKDSVSQLQAELSKSESALFQMRDHMDKMLALHEGLTEAAIGMGAEDAVVGKLIEELDKRLGGTEAQGLAEQLDNHLLVVGGKSPPPPSLVTPRVPKSGEEIPPSSPASGQLRNAVAKTRTNFMVARRYLLSTRKRAPPSPSPAGTPARDRSPEKGLAEQREMTSESIGPPRPEIRAAAPGSAPGTAASSAAAVVPGAAVSSRARQTARFAPAAASPDATGGGGSSSSQAGVSAGVASRQGLRQPMPPSSGPGGSAVGGPGGAFGVHGASCALSQHAPQPGQQARGASGDGAGDGGRGGSSGTAGDGRGHGGSPAGGPGASSSFRTSPAQQQQQQQQQQAGASSGATGRSNSGNGAVSPPAARAALVASRASLSREHVLGVSGLASGPAARGGLAGAPSGGDGVVSPPSSGFMAAACKADGASSFGSSVAAANGAPGARATTFGAAMSGRSMQTPGQQHGGRGGGGGLAHGALRERRPTDSGPGKAGGVSTVSGAQLLSVSTGSSGGAAMSPKSPPGKRDGATSSPLKLKRQHKPAASD